MYKRILVPFDGSPTSNAGLDEAVKLARLTGASIRLVHVLDHLPFSSGGPGLTPSMVDTASPWQPLRHRTALYFSPPQVGHQRHGPARPPTPTVVA